MVFCKTLIGLQDALVFIPTNTLSHIIAAEMQNKLFETTPDLKNQIEKGQFESMGSWIKDNIHSKGRSLDALAMIKNATGNALGADNLLTHLERRFFKRSSLKSVKRLFSNRFGTILPCG